LRESGCEEAILTSYLCNPTGGVSLARASDTCIFIADTGVPDNEATSSISTASNSSASATIMITMYTVADE